MFSLAILLIFFAQTGNAEFCETINLTLDSPFASFTSLDYSNNDKSCKYAVTVPIDHKVTTSCAFAVRSNMNPMQFVADNEGTELYVENGYAYWRSTSNSIVSVFQHTNGNFTCNFALTGDADLENCNCGIHQPHAGLSRVIHGEITSRHEFPSLVFLEMVKKGVLSTCGGTISKEISVKKIYKAFLILKRLLVHFPFSFRTAWGSYRCYKSPHYKSFLFWSPHTCKFRFSGF